MDEKEFNSLLDEEVSMRLQYGDSVGKLKTIFMDMATPIMWLKGASENWEDLDENSMVVVGRSLEELVEYVRATMKELLDVIQEGATYLYGEPFNEESFHETNCQCDKDHE